jgi:hypothetical protein
MGHEGKSLDGRLSDTRGLEVQKPGTVGSDCLVEFFYGLQIKIGGILAFNPLDMLVIQISQLRKALLG